MKFQTTILLTGNNTGIEVPPEIVDALEGGKKPAVIVAIGDFSYRSTIAVMGGKNLISLSAERRSASGLKGGDIIEVDLTLDTAPREVVLPDELLAALSGEPKAAAFFETLSYSNKLKHALAISEAKTPETRQRRVDKTMDMLRTGKK